MNSKIYRQHDARWAKKPYPTKNYTFAHNGCGCCAVTHLVIEQSKYANYTPENVRQFMVKYAKQGKGTLWEGITKGLQHFGHTTVKMYSVDEISKAFTELNKGNRMAVLLFGSKPGGSKKKYWTAGGHYVAAVAYKYENKKHYFYTKDSGARHNDGWHSFETTMKGALKRIWVTERVKIITPKQPTQVVPSKEESRIKMIDGMIKFANKYASDNRYVHKQSSSHKCPICHQGSSKGWGSIGFISAILHHGAGMKNIKCSSIGIGTSKFFTNLYSYAKKNPKDAINLWKAKNGSNWEMIWNNGKTIPVSKIKRGDVCVVYKGKTYSHIYLKDSGKYIYDSKSGKTQISRRKRSNKNTKLIFRPVVK